MNSVEECIPDHSVPDERFPAPIGILVTPAPNGVDRRLTLAMPAINQSLFMHLHRFSVARIKASAAGMLTAPFRQARSAVEFERDTAFAEFSPVRQSA